MGGLAVMAFPGAAGDQSKRGPRTQPDGELTLTRTAPLDSESDEIWKWFMDIRTNGISTVKAR
jgi:hypothetical protein